MARFFNNLPTQAAVRTSAPDVLYPDPSPQPVYEIPKRMTEAEEDAYMVDLQVTLDSRGFNALEKRQVFAFYRDYRASADEFHALRDSLGKKAQEGLSLTEVYTTLGEAARSQGLRIKLSARPTAEDVEKLRSKIHDHQVMKASTLVSSTWKVPQLGKFPNSTKFISPSLWWVSVGLKTYLLYPVSVLILGRTPYSPVEWVIALSLAFIMSLGFTFAIRIALVTMMGKGRAEAENNLKLPHELLSPKTAQNMAMWLFICVLIGLAGVAIVDVPASSVVRESMGMSAEGLSAPWVEFMKILLLMSLFIASTLAYEFSRMMVELANQSGPSKDDFEEVDGPYREARAIIELYGDLARRRSDALWKESRWEKFEADLNSAGKKEEDSLNRRERSKVLNVLRGHLTKFSNKGW
jgi:hypothetical protein